MLATDLTIAGRSLWQHKKRNFLLGGAIASVTALLVLLNGIETGVRRTMLDSATTLMTGHVNVGGFYKVTAGMAAPLVTDYQKVLAALGELPELDHATSRGRGYAKGVSATSSMDLVLGGIDVAAEPRFRSVVELESGKLDDLGEPGTILLFADQAKRLSVGVGDTLTLSAPTSRGVNNTVDVRVIGIGKAIGLMSSWSSFVSNDTLRGLYQLKPSSTGAIHLYLKDAAAAPRVAEALRQRLAAAGYRIMDPDPKPYWQKLYDKVNNEEWTGQKLDLTTWEDEMSFMGWILNAYGALMSLLIGVLMVIVVVGIMNTMWIAIRERTREIGTMRAIGMQRTKVMWLFLLEASLLGVVGAVLGALVGAAASLGLTAAAIGVPEAAQVFLMSSSLVLSVEPGSVVGDVVFVSVATTLAAVYPALRAAALAPVTAMHHIG